MLKLSLSSFTNKSESILTSAALVSSSIFFFSKSNSSCDNSSFYYDEEENRNFLETLHHHKRSLDKYKRSWDWNNATYRLPTVSWPLNIPSESEVSSLKFDLSFCQRRTNRSTEEDRYCSNLQFRIASFYLLQSDMNIQKYGLKMIQKLAESGHADSICAYATCLNDGRAGLDPNPIAAVSWWKNASEKYDHIQSTYELGVACYTGEGVVEDEKIAVEYFRTAAENGHVGAAYMLGDCLLDGVGVERDRGEALEWLVTAAELGHRGARSRVVAVLEKEEGKNYGKFTDSSRQTLIGHDNVKFSSGTKRDNQERLYSTKPVTLERRFTIGGGAMNPRVLARRKTIVTESRQQQ